MLFKKIFFRILYFLSFIILTSCLSNMITLEEIKPPVVVEEEKEEEAIPPVSGPILEIEEVGGEQKYIYLKLGTKNRIRKWLKGYIFNDEMMVAKIGKFQLIEVYSDFSKGKILELNYKIKPGAVVQIEIDPKNLIE